MNRIIEKFRDPQVWGFFLSMAVMLVISVAFFYPDNFEGNTLSQPDMMQGLANSHESDLYEQATGEKALWTNSLFSGMPTFQIKPTYPSNSLFSWINKVFGLFLPSPSNLLFMMMFGFLIMMYCMGQKWYYGLMGAVAWCFSTYFIIIIGAGHIWKFVTLSYIPPTIGGLVLCYRGRHLLGGALAALFAMMQLNSNHPQMSYYFAFVMVAFAAAYLVYAIRDKKMKQWAQASGMLVIAMVLALGANLPSIYNSYTYARETQRAQSELTQPSAYGPTERPTGGMPKSQIVGWSYGQSEMFSLLVPNIKGGASAKPVGGKMVPVSVSEIDGAENVYSPEDRSLLPYFSQYFNDSEGTNGPVYVGALVCALFLLGCFIVRGPIKWALLVLTILSCLLALGRNFESLTDFMIYNFPMYSKFRAVESILVIAEFTMPLLAVLALVQFIQDAVPAKEEKQASPAAGRLMQAFYLSFGLCFAICLLALMVPSMFGDAITGNDREIFRQLYEHYGYNTMQLQDSVQTLRYSLVRDDALRSLILLILGGGALWMYARRYIGRYVAVAAIGVLTLFDLYQVDKRYVSSESFTTVSPMSSSPITFVPDEADNAILADKDPHYRVMDFAGFGDARRSYFHKMIGGYHAAKLGRYNDLITTGRIANDNVLDMLNAKYFIGQDREGRIISQYNPAALGNAWIVDSIAYVDGADAEIEALDLLDPAVTAVADEQFRSILGDKTSAPVPGDTIYLTSYSPNTLKYNADTQNGGIGVFSEVWFPWGWKATIDGEEVPIGRVDYVLRALRLPAGSHEVVMTFNPASVRSTQTVAYASVIIIYLLLALAVFKRIKNKIDYSSNRLIE